MQLFATLLIAASLAASALALSISRISARDAASNFYPGTHTGDGTWYETGIGACGITNHDTDYIVAVAHSLWDAYPGFNGGNANTNPICGRKIKANYQGKSVTVTVVDKCMGCDKEGSLDFSPSAFTQLADRSVGRLLDMTWTWAC